MNTRCEHGETDGVYCKLCAEQDETGETFERYMPEWPAAVYEGKSISLWDARQLCKQTWQAALRSAKKGDSDAR